MNPPVCPECEGEAGGGDPFTRCTHCQGTGEDPEAERCSEECEGDGECQVCDGTGWFTD